MPATGKSGGGRDTGRSVPGSPPSCSQALHPFTPVRSLVCDPPQDGGGLPEEAGLQMKIRRKEGEKKKRGPTSVDSIRGEEFQGGSVSVLG